jgi:cysteine desulfurase
VIYLDNAATTPLRPQAFDALREAGEVVGNPASVHAAGRAARALLEESRERIAACVGAHPSEVVFTSGGTEANNLALRGLGAERVLVSAVEHASILNIPQVELIRVDDAGRVPRTELPGESTPGERCLVSIQQVNSETGVIQPLWSAPGTLRHSDAVQGLGHLPLDFAGSGLDALTITAHKVGGPVGIGALLLKRGVAVRPISYGGEQETKRRPGTVPVALAAGFAAAVEAATGDLDAETTRLKAMHDRLIGGALDAIADVRVNCTPPCSPAIVNLTICGLRAEDLLLLLDQRGICVSLGSACTAGVARPSAVLLAMGRSEADASASIRFSFGWQNTMAEVEEVLRVLPDSVAQARAAFAG